MLLERTNDLLTLLDIYEKSKELSSRTTDLNNRLRVASDIYNVLVRVEARKIFFLEEKIDTDLKDVFAGLNSALQSLKSSIKENSAAVLEPHAFWKMNPGKLESDSEKVFLLDWTAYINDHLHFNDKKELEMWAQIPELASSAKRLKEFVEEVEEIKEKLPDIHQVMLIKKMAVDMQKFFDNLEKVGIPENVRNFLDKATSVGISLADINTDLFNWLKEHDMLQYCQVRLANNE
ncbi:hypothetical protein [Sulfurovum sp.]|uniref:hypothetical protein n=1 Tax=Sulfurovum sp. TaxID=1969726 RepID=UPI0035647151